MSSDYIEELIRQGENTSIEFKREDVRRESCEGTYCFF